MSSFASNGNSENIYKENNKTYYQLKITLVGDSSVGKTSIITRFIENKFAQGKAISSLTANFINHSIKLDNFTEVSMEIWDTAGQERFRSLTSTFINHSNGIFIVFDLGYKKSFENLEYWLEQIENATIEQKNCIKILIGNKFDLEEKEVNDDIIKEFAEKNNLKYLATSAKDGKNVISMFKIMADMCVKSMQNEEKNNQNIYNEVNKINQKNEKKKQKVQETEQKSIHLSNKQLKKEKNKLCC